MELGHSLFLGILEGLTEFLPISSTGHLILASTLFGIPESATAKSFFIAIQVGAILAVVVLYARQFLRPAMLARLTVAFVPTGIIGLAFYHFVKTHLLGNGTVVAWALIAGGVALIAFEHFHREPPESEETVMLPYRTAFLVGLFQSIAIIPGVSRSAATIMGGLSLGLPRRTIIEFSFLLAVPTMLAATGYDLVRSYQYFSADDFYLLLVGFVASFVIALGSMRFMIEIVKKWGFTPFGWYRIVLGLFFLIYILP